MPLRPGAFPFFSLFMAHLTSANLIGLSINVMHGLFKEVQDGMVYWLMVVKHLVEVRTNY